MCGIVGYIGKREAYPVLIKGLHRLEYRGYDSAGIAFINDSGELNVYKKKGKVKNLEDYAEGKDLSGHIGIAHTRWATHGEPNDVNAHPHLSNSGNIALIHNGIIENYLVLKEALTQNGFKFMSNTDTEVLVNLIEYVQKINNCSLFDAVIKALKQVIGAYAIAVIEKSHPDQIIIARQNSPLAVGIGKDEYFFASDASPIVEYMEDVVYLNDGEVALIKPGTPLQVVDRNKAVCKVQIQHLEMSISELEKGGYAHFMLKEIHEQPHTVYDCIRGRVSAESQDVIISGVQDHKDKFLNAKRIIFVACGTSWHASLIGGNLIEEFCRIPTKVEYASEFRYRNPVIHKDDVVIAVSQSGETADTLAAIELAKKSGAFVFGICNVIGSSVARQTDSGCYIHVGPEIGVASTKAFTGQVTVMTMLALNIAKLKHTIEEKRFKEIIKGLLDMPKILEETLKMDATIADLAKRFMYANNFMYLGRGYNYPTAMEGALKLKEISYIHAEGYPAAEMKHGPIALIDYAMPVVAIAVPDTIYEKVASNIEEIKSRKGTIIAVVSENDTRVAKMADFCIKVPIVDECLMPLVVILPLQLFAYYVAVYKNCDVDQPRNLAKSVTVE